jgi:hypothetical protein
MCILYKLMALCTPTPHIAAQLSLQAIHYLENKGI